MRIAHPTESERDMYRNPLENYPPADMVTVSTDMEWPGRVSVTLHYGNGQVASFEGVRPADALHALNLSIDREWKRA